jgi:ABC-type antimicrobial peptide transport system permease subunit
MGTGAVVATPVLPPPALNPQGSPIPGPNAELIDVRAGVTHSHALASLDRITAVLNRGSDDDGPVGGVVSDLRPAEIANYRAVGSLPFVLAGVIAGAAILALGLTLVASVRRRRHEFALLKAVGLSQGQIVSTVAWQATVSAALGCVVGVPVGIVVGRSLWSSFAHGIFAVPHPTVPVLSVVLVAVGALVFANAVAAVPGRIAARTPTATLFTEH